MPRTTTVESPGCPPLRALSFDSLGLVKVIEARGKERGEATVVDRWGDPDSSRCVLAASLDDRKREPLLAVARKNSAIEVLNPLNGDLCFAFSVSGDDGAPSEDDEVTGLHLFRTQKMDQTARSCTLLTCTKKGNASLRSISFPDTRSDSPDDISLKAWKACGCGEILFGKVNGSEKFGLFGGKRVEVNMWDLHQYAKIWTAKSPAKNSLGIFTPTWFTCATFMSNDDHSKFVAGTNSHQVRLYDISAQRRPVLSFDFRENPIKAIAEDPDGYTVYVGNSSGDLGSFDIRTGKLLGCFVGKCSGSIRSVVRHPHHPVIASCGLDRYLRFWDVETRQLLSAVFLKQHLTGVVFDSSFTSEDTVVRKATDAEAQKERAENEDEQSGDEAEERHVKRKKSKKDKRRRKAAPEEDEGSKKLKSKKKKSRKVKHDED